MIADDFKSKSKNSPFDGRPVQGRVLRTVVDGRVVFDDLNRLRDSSVNPSSKARRAAKA